MDWIGSMMRWILMLGMISDFLALSLGNSCHGHFLEWLSWNVILNLTWRLYCPIWWIFHCQEFISVSYVALLSSSFTMLIMSCSHFWICRCFKSDKVYVSFILCFCTQHCWSFASFTLICTPFPTNDRESTSSIMVAISLTSFIMSPSLQVIWDTWDELQNTN